MTHDLVLEGRTLLPDGRLVDGDVGVRDGRIAAVGERGALAGEERIDCGGDLILPGHVDVHVHTGSEPAEGMRRATAAAAAGGATTIVDMPYDDPVPVSTADAFERKTGLVAAEALVDVGLWGTVAKEGPLDAIPALIEAGACAFKASTYDTHPTRFPRIPDGQLYDAMRAVHAGGGLIGIHAENDELIRHLTARAGGGGDSLTHAAVRPPVAETEAIGRVLELALATAVRVHVCHVTVERGFELVARARADGADVTAETCTHYLTMDESELVRQGARAKINPPLRPAAQVEALWRLLEQGRIDLVTSDHVGWTPARKEGDILTARAGVPGLELTVPLLFGEGVVRRGLPLARLAQVLCEAPARRFGLWPRKGAIAPGADADLIVLDPRATWRVDEAQLVTAAGWSPYHGRELTGRIRRVLVRGCEVARDGEVTGTPGWGRVVRPRDDTPVPVPG